MKGTYEIRIHEKKKDESRKESEENTEKIPKDLSEK